MRILRSRLLGLAGAAAVCALLSTAISAGTANASPESAGSQAKNEYCVVKLMPLQRGQSASRVVSRTCSDQHAQGSDLPLGFSPNSSVNIITVYQNTNYSGKQLIFMGAQPCSPSYAYYIPDTKPSDNGAGNWGANSWQAHSSCWHTEVYYGTNYGSPGYLYAQGVWEAAYIGSPFNNHVWSIVTAYS